MSKKYLNPKELPNWEQTFTQVVISHSPSTTVYLSGQVAVDGAKNLIGGNDLGSQAMQAFHNLRLALAAAGATETDVVKLTIYIKNYKPADADAVITALQTYFPHKELPASTWLGVLTLADERFLIELDAIAVVEHENEKAV